MKQLTILFTALLLTTAAFAQKTDFSGNWSFTEQSSISGKLYSNGSPKAIKITLTATAITLEKTSAGASGDVTTSETVSLDGKPFETVTPTTKRKKVITIAWSSNSALTEIASLYNATDPAKLDFKTTDTYTVENGELVLDRKTENFTNGETWESKANYSKK